MSVRARACVRACMHASALTSGAEAKMRCREGEPACHTANSVGSKEEALLMDP